jgi:activator of HSP90 ATPase
MDKALDLSILLPGSPEQIYTAWLSSQAHSQFTGAAAQIDPREGGAFSAWDDYIQGRTLALEPYRRIFQSWRTTEFPQGAPDSFLEVLFQAEGSATRLTLRHTDIPDGQAEQYRQGWEDYYFKPMQEYFAG